MVNLPLWYFSYDRYSKIRVYFGAIRDSSSANNLLLKKEPNKRDYYQLSSPVPELSFLPTPYRGWTRAGERRVQDNLHAHAQNEPMKNYWS